MRESQILYYQYYVIIQSEKIVLPLSTLNFKYPACNCCKKRIKKWQSQKRSILVRNAVGKLPSGRDNARIARHGIR